MFLGLMSAPKKIMCMINSIFNKYLENLVLGFINDILVSSKTKEEHEEHLRIVLRVLREH